MTEPAEDNVLPFTAKPTITVVMVTPEMAARWLEKNVSNRTIRQNRVNQYVRDMKAGNWKLTAEPVKFSITGRLLDGQHRLWAVVEANTTVPLFVARGLPDDVQQYMDSGSARSAGDNLHMRGELNSNVLAAAARIGIIVDGGMLYRDRTQWSVSKSEIYRWIDEHPEMRRSASFVVTGDPKKVLQPGSIKAFCHYRFSLVDEFEADAFFCSLGSLVNLEQGSAIHALSSRLYQLGAKRVKVELPDALSMMFRAWNAHRAGRRIANIPLKSPRISRELPDLI